MRDRTLYDDEAREIASSWHGGGGSALYVLASTGAISDRTLHEIDIEIAPLRELIRDGIYEQRDLDYLLSLRDYVVKSGNRGEVRGWNDTEWHEGL